MANELAEVIPIALSAPSFAKVCRNTDEVSVFYNYEDGEVQILTAGCAEEGHLPVLDSNKVKNVSSINVAILCYTDEFDKSELEVDMDNYTSIDFTSYMYTASFDSFEKFKEFYETIGFFREV